ncbi:MAG: hypothetical protein FD147_758 [Chloroflexi bacterium]|nr:MAG: hypothetical protein FD147_758 [Chloroflexota bacterium]
MIHLGRAGSVTEEVFDRNGLRAIVNISTGVEEYWRQGSDGGRSGGSGRRCVGGGVRGGGRGRDEDLLNALGDQSAA